MQFQTGAGRLDILANDWVLINPDALTPAPNVVGIVSDGYRKVLAVNVGNTTQIQIQEVDGSQLWLDAAWVIGCLRPILPS